MEFLVKLFDRSIRKFYTNTVHIRPKSLIPRDVPQKLLPNNKNNVLLWQFQGHTTTAKIGSNYIHDDNENIWPLEAKSRLTEKDTDAGKHWKQGEKGMTEDEMVEWHHGFNGHEFEQALGDSEGWGSLVCCSPWGHWVRHDWATE